MEPEHLVDILAGNLALLQQVDLVTRGPTLDVRRLVCAQLMEARNTVDRLGRYGLAADDFDDRRRASVARNVEGLRGFVTNSLEIASLSLFSGSAVETCMRDITRAVRALGGLVDAERDLVRYAEAPEPLSA